LKKIGNLSPRHILFLTLLSFGVLTSASSFADSVQVQAIADTNSVGLGETVTITVSVQSQDSLDAEEPRIPAIDGFSLLNSWTSSSTSSKLMQANGGMKFETVRRQDFNFTFAPGKTGLIQVSPFTVVVNGKSYATKPFNVRVENGGGQARAQRRPQQPAQGQGFQGEDPLDDAEALFQQMLQNRGIMPPTGGGSTGKPHNPNESFFVQLDTDKKTVFEGEQITANWYIYTRGNILALDRVKFPDLKGFWKEIIEEVPALNFQQEIINGVAYRKALLASHALFPIKAGTAVIDEYKIKATVQVANGPFGFGPPYSFTRVSERLPVKVLPLPTEGRPADFTGAVGEFNIQASVEGKNFPMNQPFTLKVRFDGAGNAKNIDLPPLKLPAGTEIYDTKNESKYFKNGRSYKEFTVLIIPRQQGEIEIPAFGASMFDPVAKKYYQRSTQPIKIAIGPAVNGENSNLAANAALDKPNTNAESSKKKAPELPDIVRAWQPQTSILKSLKEWQGPVGLGLWALFFLLSLLKVLTLFAKKGGSASLKNFIDVRSKVCRKRIEASDWRGAGTEVSNLIYGVLGELAGEKGGSNELQKLLEKAPPSIRRELGPQIAKQVDLFQTVGFAPESATAALRDKSVLMKELQSVVKTLNRALELGQKK
jgi:hypothetical protein